MSANVQVVHAGQVDAGGVGDVGRSIGKAAIATAIEVILGAGLLCLFVLALACDPLDRRFSTRGKRITERSRRLMASGGANGEGAYAILPAD
ncbi:MAG: hypothetical protein ACR2NO_12165 [Chloroflexota bacterium]